jgi:hypothetical protein
MDATQSLALMLDPSLIFKAQGLTCDPWQSDLLLSTERQIILNCSRQSGKSKVTAALALHTALFHAGSLILLLSRAQRQAHELFRKVLDAYNDIGRPVPLQQDTQSVSKIELANGSRIIGLPGKEDTIRGFSGVNLLIIDEAAKVPDDLYRSVRPMLAVSQGRLVLLSTPFGQRGFFWREWHRKDGEAWKRVKIDWTKCPRITADYIAEERQALGDSWVRQEYECSFEAMEGLVYPDFAEKTEWTIGLIPNGKPVGGIDFGWRNPFAAVWGVLDKDDVLWIHGERYLRECPLHEHTKALRHVSPRMWYADPAGRTETEEMRAAGLTVRKGHNDIRLGIAAVNARIRTGRLKVHFPSCLNMIEEAKAYRYPREDERAKIGENPIDADNHALAALRYLISRVDQRFIAKLRKSSTVEGPEEIDTQLQEEERIEREEDTIRSLGVKPWNRIDNEALWERLN